MLIYELDVCRIHKVAKEEYFFQFKAFCTTFVAETVQNMELPASFTDYTRRLLGTEEAARLFAAFDGEQPVSIRVHPQKSGGLDALPLCERVPWCASGYYLDRRLTFTFDPLFHAGCYYVQEASSMFVEQALRQCIGEEPVVMLDLCAAPGGKSTLARTVLPEGSLLVANEVIRNRSQVLAENLTKWGHAGVVVTNSEPESFSPLQGFFDVILADVPCSGEGMFRKDPVAVSEWSMENVEICWQRQRRILFDVWGCLKPNGILIYSTCTYNTKENEANIRWVCDELGAEVLPLQVPDEWHIEGNLLPDGHFPVYRFLPHKTKGEGFFLAVLRKSGDEADDARPGRKEQKERSKRGHDKGTKSSFPSKEQLSTLRSWLSAPDDYELLADGTAVSAFPRQHFATLNALRSSLHVVQAGVSLAELKGKDCLPAHALAMSRLLKPDTFPCEEVSYEQAIAYLRKEAVTLSATTPRGIVLLTYHHVPIGFVKNIGNRANNLYPAEWRIRSTHLPETVAELAHYL